MSDGTFKDRSFAQRFQAMGDQAEAIFDRVYPYGKVQFGLNRPPIHLASVPAFVRYTPDRLTAKSLVEIQGFGGDATFKLKKDKLAALLAWQEASEWRVDLFVYDSKNNEYAWVRLADFVALTERPPTGVEVRSFPEGTAYWAVPKALLPVTEEGWTAVPEVAA